MRAFGLGSGGGRGSGGPRRHGFFGIALECDMRGQINGKSSGVFESPTTDTFIHDTIYEAGTFLKGANWEVYKTAAVARGADAADFVEDATTVTPQDSAVEPFLSLFDVVFVNPHQNGGIPPIDIKAVKTLAATAQVGKRRYMTERPPDFVFHGWKDDMPTGPHTSTLWSHYYEGIKDNGLFMRGTGPNSTNGALTCDPEETTAWPGGTVKDIFADPPTETAFGSVSGHNWHVDYTKPGFGEIMAELAVQQYQAYWNASGGAGEPVDHFIVHDLIPKYPARAGSATNLPTITDGIWIPATTRVADAYAQAFRNISPTAGQLWSATGSHPGRTWSGYDDILSLRGLYYNYQWANATTVAQFAADVRRAALRMVPIAFGCESVHASHEVLFETPDHPDWWTMLAAARERDWEENTYIACRSVGGMEPGTSIGYLFWTPAMRPVG